MPIYLLMKLLKNIVTGDYKSKKYSRYEKCKGLEYDHVQDIVEKYSVNNFQKESLNNMSLFEPFCQRIIDNLEPQNDGNTSLQEKINLQSKNRSMPNSKSFHKYLC